MKTLIKQIRTYLNLSQAELADQLNVSFETVVLSPTGWHNLCSLTSVRRGLFLFMK